MGKRLTLQPATHAELASLSDWYATTGVAPAVVSAIRDDTVPKFIQAHNGGFLGTAVGGTFHSNLQALLDLPLDRWRYARTYVAALRLDGRTIGMLHIGPPPRHYWDYLLTPTVRAWTERVESTGLEDVPEDVARFITGTLVIDKVALVAVTPDERRRGHGIRLIKHALHTARTGKSAILYGQFSETNAGMRAFYTKAGFDALQPGEPLDIYMATGTIGTKFDGNPTEAFFVKRFRG